MVNLPYINPPIDNKDDFYPPKRLCLIHDFMSLSITQLKVIYKELNKSSSSTLCDNDIDELIVCYKFKKKQRTREKLALLNFPFL